MTVIYNPGELVDLRSCVQLDRAEPTCAEEWLHWMNARHAVIDNHNGRTVIVAWDNGRWVVISKTSLLLRYCNRRVAGMKLGQWWLAHPQRRQHRMISEIG